MLTSRHKTTLVVPLCVSSSPIHNYSFLFAGTEFGTFRTNNPASHFVQFFPIPRSTILLPLGIQTQLCVLSQLWDAKCCLICFCFHSEQRAFCMRRQETHSISKDFIRKSWSCWNNYADINSFQWFWLCLKLCRLWLLLGTLHSGVPPDVGQVKQTSIFAES